jgi:hypothetical protein
VSYITEMMYLGDALTKAGFENTLEYGNTPKNRNRGIEVFGQERLNRIMNGDEEPIPIESMFRVVKRIES